MRTFVIPDIHGCHDKLLNILSQIDLQKEDHFYLLGDVIDRGVHSKEVVELIISLIKDGYNVLPIMGNHEQMLLQAIDYSGDRRFFDLWYYNGGDATLKSYGGSIDMIPEEHINFFRCLPLFRETESHVFTHASLSTNQKPLSPDFIDDFLWKRFRVRSTKNIQHRTLVSGHTVKPLEFIIKNLNRKHIQLDNGAFMTGREGFGSLVCLELETMNLYLS